MLCLGGLEWPSCKGFHKMKCSALDPVCLEWSSLYLYINLSAVALWPAGRSDWSVNNTDYLLIMVLVSGWEVLLGNKGTFYPQS